MDWDGLRLIALIILAQIGMVFLALIFAYRRAELLLRLLMPGRLVCTIFRDADGNDHVWQDEQHGPLERLLAQRRNARDGCP